jgi:predicted acylesterase/phospholipase RssA
MSEADPLPGFEDRAPRDRYCDLILTGGVTSAIAYPAAIFALATAYRFNSIGGSSSGAGSAALAAAAEYRRRHGSADGFRILLERTADVAEDADGTTRLARLFQPEQGNERLFNALVPAFAKPHGKSARLASGLLRAYARSWEVVAGVVALSVIWLALFLAAGRGIGVSTGWFTWGGATTGILLGVLAVLFAALVLVVVFIRVARDVARVVRNDYGLCTGKTSQDTPHLPLTDWLHALIQEIAGRAVDDPPLTFADLAAAPGSPRETLGDPCGAGSDSINLQMYAANVTHGKPYVFPQQETQAGDDPQDDDPLYFRTSEMTRLFPASVVEFMTVDPLTGQKNPYRGGAKAAPARAGVGAARTFASLAMGTSEVVGSEEEPMYPLPRKRLPIIVAARMSVSFPVLFSAVPLWVLDHRVQPPEFRRCLFSDGSLCSTFPIHLFDSAIPSWPTFGISLHELPPSAPGKLTDNDTARAWFSTPDHDRREYGAVWLPEHHLEGTEYFWSEFETEPRTFDKLSGFANAVLSTMKDWNDATLARLPGVRERVVRVGLYPGIGGLNILMTGDEIRGLADLGRQAALKLLRRYALPAPSTSGKPSDGWNEHRWVRLNVLLNSLSEFVGGLTWAAAQERHGKPLRELIDRAVDEPPLSGDKSLQLLPAQAAALAGALDVLMQAERTLTAPTAEQPYKPSPRPVMRVRPPL